MSHERKESNCRIVTLLSYFPMDLLKPFNDGLYTKGKIIALKSQSQRLSMSKIQYVKLYILNNKISPSLIKLLTASAYTFTTNYKNPYHFFLPNKCVCYTIYLIFLCNTFRLRNPKSKFHNHRFYS